jgi:hypothetical protein
VAAVAAEGDRAARPTGRAKKGADAARARRTREKDKRFRRSAVDEELS